MVLVLALPHSEFTEFSRFVEMGLMSEGAFHLDTSLLGFAGLVWPEQVTPTMKDFEAGAAYLLTNPRLSLVVERSQKH